MKIKTVYKIFYSVLVIFLLGIAVNTQSYRNDKGINSFLKNNFNVELFEKHQLEKQIITNQLINDQPELYSFSSSFLNDIVSLDGSSLDYSGSGQNFWYGETCNQTTFNKENVTTCLNDCHQSWGQGICNGTTSTCICNYFFTGPDCSDNIDAEHNWDIIDCNGGRYCPPIYNYPGPRKCFCPSGQTGIDCSVCNSNLGCNSLKNNYNNDYICDNSINLATEKTYSCIVTSEEVNGDLNNSTASVLIDCQFPNKIYNKSLGECSMDLYYKIEGPPLYFNCSFNECNLSMLPSGIQLIQCGQSACNCSTYCGFILDGLISQVTGSATFECETNNLNNCTFSQYTINQMLPVIPLSCKAGECIIKDNGGSQSSNNNNTTPNSSNSTNGENGSESTNESGSGGSCSGKSKNVCPPCDCNGNSNGNNSNHYMIAIIVLLSFLIVLSIVIIVLLLKKRKNYYSPINQ
ncbi:hypothetical protein ACTA71_012464 [Dictyostelium dimigraforme]